MRSIFLGLALVAACGGAPSRPAVPHRTAAVAPDRDPDGPHRAAVAAQVQPLVDHGIVTGIVVGLYDAGHREIYGFGKGPRGAPPDGRTLFELGSVTKVYTSLLLADAVQRREVALDTPASELLPPGVTMPTRDRVAITLGHLALHISGLPRLPPSIAARGTTPDPYSHYDENALYADLVRTELEHKPGEEIVFSNYGTGLLGFVLGRKLGAGGGYAQAVADRIFAPLGLHDTFVTVPAAAAARRAQGTNDDLAPVPPWTFDAMAGAGALVSDARDQLALVDAELDAASGGKLPLRGAMRLTQEPQLAKDGDNEGIGWQIDGAGRYWQDGGTGGFRSFVGFDPKTRRGVVVLASTSVSVIDHIVDDMYKLLDAQQVKPPAFPTAAQLAPLAGTYELGGQKIVIVARGDRLYLEGGGGAQVGKVRLVPFSNDEFWIEELQSIAAFQRAGDKIARLVFVIGGQQMSAARVP